MHSFAQQAKNVLLTNVRLLVLRLYGNKSRGRAIVSGSAILIVVVAQVVGGAHSFCFQIVRW
jgi:hypothetical protein